MSVIIFEGSGAALVPHFNEDRTINYDKLKEFIEFRIENFTDVL